MPYIIICTICFSVTSRAIFVCYNQLWNWSLQKICHMSGCVAACWRGWLLAHLSPPHCFHWFAEIYYNYNYKFTTTSAHLCLEVMLDFWWSLARLNIQRSGLVLLAFASCLWYSLEVSHLSTCQDSFWDLTASGLPWLPRTGLELLKIVEVQNSILASGNESWWEWKKKLFKKNVWRYFLHDWQLSYDLNQGNIDCHSFLRIYQVHFKL